MKAPVKIFLTFSNPRYKEFFIEDTQVMLPSVPGIKLEHTIRVGPLAPYSVKGA